jgi:hypothetical protein
MPKYEISGSFKVEIIADDPRHAEELLWKMTLSQVSTEGELETYEPDYIAPDHSGEAADAGYDAMMGARDL